METSTDFGRVTPASYSHIDEMSFDSNQTIVNFTTLMDNSTRLPSPQSPFQSPPLQTSSIVTIPLYVLIFVLSVVGNLLVIITLVQNKGMRTVTNVFLLNLSVSDLLLAVFCMPFTIIPIMLQNFIFGGFICVSIRYLQGKFTMR